ncbi:MAG TPA: TolC family protein [Gammaproteobacteria bacterium]|nr:TolC family protein [Gammaproteobacteria bacterium]
MLRIAVITVALISSNVLGHSYVNKTTITALKNSELLKADKHALKSAYYNLKKSYSGLLPEVTYSLQHGYDFYKAFNALANDPKKKLTKSTHTFTLDQHLFDGGKTEARTLKAKQTYLKSMVEFKIAESKTIKSFLKDYGRAYYAYKYHSLAQQKYAFSQDYYESESKKHKAGLVSKVKSLTAKKTMETNLFDVMKESRNLNEKRRIIRDTTKLYNIKLIKPRLNLKTYSISEMKKSIKQQNLETKLSKIKAEIKKLSRSESMANLYSPEIDIIGKHVYDKNASGVEGYSRNKFIGISVQYSPFSGGNDLNDYKASKQNYREAYNVYLDKLSSSKRKLSNLYYELIDAQQEVQLTKKLEAEYKDLSLGAEKGFKAGKVTPQKLYLIRQNHIKLTKNKFKAEENALLTKIELLYVLGQLNISTIK